MHLIQSQRPSHSRSGRVARIRRRIRALPLHLVQSLALLLCLVAPAHAKVELNADTGGTTAGYFQLSWQSSDQAIHFFQLLQSRDPGFTHPRILYRGTDHASLLSGQANGRYYYRVIAIAKNGDADVSNDVTVTVEHHPLDRALLFFGIGAVVFLATMFTIILGNRRYRS